MGVEVGRRLDENISVLRIYVKIDESSITFLKIRANFIAMTVPQTADSRMIPVSTYLSINTLRKIEEVKGKKSLSAFLRAAAEEYLEKFAEVDKVER